MHRARMTGMIKLDYVTLRRAMAAVAIGNDLPGIIDRDGTSKNNAQVRRYEPIQVLHAVSGIPDEGSRAQRTARSANDLAVSVDARCSAVVTTRECAEVLDSLCGSP